jgi:hypothetical protein
MNPVCFAARTRIPNLEPGEQLTGRLGRHAESCLRCQAEGVRYRSLHRGLRHLSGEVIVAPEQICEAVLHRIGAEAVPSDGRSRRSRIRAAIAMAAASAAMVATAGTVAALGWWRFRVVT